MAEEVIIKSRELLKPKVRKPYQTTKFIYQALDVAEKQIEELTQSWIPLYLEEIEECI